jgi:hypothetical protein
VRCVSSVELGGRNDEALVFRVLVQEFRGKNSRFRVQCSFNLKGLGFRAKVLWFLVQHLG